MSVTVIGDAFIDLIVPVQGTKPGETHHRKIITLCGGTANVAVQIAKFGKKSKFVGKVGDDSFGMYFRQNLRMNGVKDLTFVDGGNPTGLCISLSYEKGERTMVANRGANDYLKKEEVRSCIDKITDSKIVYFSGYSLLSKRNAESVLHAIEECHKQNCKIYFNPGAPNLIKEDFKQILCDFVEVLILNEEEARNMTKKKKIEDIAKSLSAMADTVVITMSEGGCIISKGDEYHHLETEKLGVLDTTGAGDAFSAGFILGRLRDMNEVKCARLGNETAANFLKEKMELLQ
jgi:sugar/nucleoside kinase (ribokinase family)